MQENLQSAITEVGKYTAKYAFLYEKVISDKSNDVKDTEIQQEEQTQAGRINQLKDKKQLEDVNPNENKDSILDSLVGATINSVFIKQKLKDFIDVEEIDKSCIRNGYSGLNFFKSRLLEEEGIIDIVVIYKIHLPLEFISVKDMTMVQRVRLRAWTGYQPLVNESQEENNESKEETVYITETGSVYHLSADCTHLKLSVKDESISNIKMLRNLNGGKYKECEICINDEDIEKLSTIFITDTGDRYHRSILCSGLKRTVREVPISKVKDHRPCKRCGNR